MKRYLRFPSALQTALAVCLSLSLAPESLAENAFELRESDRVAFLGDTFFERAVRFGRIETALTARWPDRKIVFRNLGWSGDSPEGRARVFFGDLTEGYKNLNAHLDLAKPTVALVSYGAMASFDGPAGIEPFISKMGDLLDTLEERGIRLILVSPTPREYLGAPLPYPKEQNQNLSLYVDALKSLAKQRKALFIDLFNTMETRSANRGTRAITDNGIHLNDYGYFLAGERIAQAFGEYPATKRLVLNKSGGVVESEGVSLLSSTAEAGDVGIRIQDEQLSPAFGDGDFSRNLTLAFTGLPRGDYRLEFNGKSIATGSAGQWKRGIQLAFDPAAEQIEALREAIDLKNNHFFHQWRPQNETYIRGFRKHEQGQNAADIPKFQPYIEAEEMKIEELKRPKPYTLTLKRVEGGEG